MKRWMQSLLAALLVLPLLGGCGYNEIQRQEEGVFKAWADVEATYQRRADLIPNLVETVKAYAAHERETLEQVTAARASVGRVQLNAANLSDPQQVEQFLAAQQQMSGALSRLLLVAERYPDLKASQNFRDLQHQLEGTENRINVARQRYNEAVQQFNSAIRTFPGNLTNKFLLKLERKEPFKAEAGAASAPQVKF
ncbi:MAG: LemA family protein [Desulfuromonas sp.]|jgi:LemA protein|uniref:LemA family protein n=1 Tax=Desulfuromonas thiophila TaxID=57664 RepID=UPI0024A86438|nr:LemA family protein [Desulfuromonas thiophila]MDY0397080.1 LemA family protein [Desulfuromonas thiophila]